MRSAQRAGAIAVAAGVTYGCTRQQLLRWGATDAEVLAPLPGDDLIADPSVVTTRAIAIEAPADAVWPWLVQMGQGRGGLYSDDWLENLFGLAAPLEWVADRMLEPVHFAMERKQLLGIKQRAERHASSPDRHAPGSDQTRRHHHGTVHRRRRRLQRQ